MSREVGEEVEVKVDEALRSMMRSQMKWREEVKIGSVLSQIRLTLEIHGGYMDETQLVQQMVKYFSLQPGDVTDALKELRNYNMILYRGRSVKLLQSKKPTEEDVEKVMGSLNRIVGEVVRRKTEVNNDSR